jgi:hypothetical protein
MSGALGIAVREFWHEVPLRSGISFLGPGECVWLLAYPLGVPNTPRKIVIASLLAASMGPAGLAISAVTTGTPIGQPLETATYFLIERHNLTMRMSIRRFTRPTNAFSRKVENYTAAVALHSVYDNF